MRIWDIKPEYLCRNHLLGEHRELHAIWSVLVNGKKGYSFHPETKRWKGKLAALYFRHQLLVKELEKRGYSHSSPLDEKLAKGKRIQELYINSLEEQRAILRNKPCQCN